MFLHSIKPSVVVLAIGTEKYTRGVSAVESILTLDRLRQNVAIKELEQTHGQPLSMRKTVSVPNFSQVSVGRLGFCWDCVALLLLSVYYYYCSVPLVPDVQPRTERAFLDKQSLFFVVVFCLGW